MLNHFSDIHINKEVEQNGFAVVPFASAEELQDLKLFYNTLPETNSKGTYVTMFHPSYEYRKKVEQKIRQLFAAKAENSLINYRVLFTNYMVKEPGPEGDFPVHQDWTYVDETKYASYAFWIPLSDVGATNGALHVVPGSHKFITHLRGPFIYEPFKELSEEIKKKYSQPVNLKAGEALIWDHRLIHYSLPNLSDQPRIAFTLILVPEEAEVIHCFSLDEEKGRIINKYSVDTDFFFTYTIGQKPQGVTLIEQFNQQLPTFVEQELEQMINLAR